MDDIKFNVAISKDNKKRGMAWYFCILLFVMGLIPMVRTINNNITYLRVCDDAISVVGIITSIREYTDDEDDTTYTAYVSYLVDEVEYTERYMSSSSKLDLPFEGAQVSFLVNPEDHGQLMSELQTDIGLFVMECVWVAAAFSGFMARLRVQKLNAQYNPDYDEESVKNDLRVVVRTRYLRPFYFAVAVCYHGMILAFPELYADKMHFIIAWGVTALFAICVLKAIKDSRDIENKKYVLKVETVVNKTEEEDSDSESFIYYLHYSDGETTWKRRVDSLEYKNTNVGDSLKTCRLGTEYKPSLVYVNGVPYIKGK